MNVEGTAFCKKFIKRWFMVLIYNSWIWFIWLFSFWLGMIKTTEASENLNVMKALRGSFVYKISNSSKSIWFLAGVSEERSCTGIKYQLVINMNTKKVFTFTFGDDHSTYVSLNFLCWVRKKMWLFRVCFQKNIGEPNKELCIFSRSCNTLFTFFLVGWAVLPSV